MDIGTASADVRHGTKYQDRLFSEISLIVDRAGPWRLVSSWLWQTCLGQEPVAPIQADPSYFPFLDQSAAPVLLWRRPIETAERERPDRVGPGFVVNVEIDGLPARGPADTLVSLNFCHVLTPDAPVQTMPAQVLDDIAGRVRAHGRAMMAVELEIAARAAASGAQLWAILADRRILWRSPAAAALEPTLFKARSAGGLMIFADEMGEAGLRHALRMLDTHPEKHEERFVVSVKHKSGSRFLIMRLRREATPSPWLSGIGWFQLIARMPDLETPAPEDLFRVFGLTPKEAALAAELYNGGTLLSYAKSRNISHETARSQSKRLMFKLNVKKQSQLIRLLAHIAN